MAKKVSTYNSNPFTLSFTALGRFFEHNAPWAVFLIAIALFGSFMRFAGNVLSSLAPHTSSAATTAEPNSVMLFVILGLLFIGVGIIGLALVVAGYTYLSGMYSYVALQSLDGKKVGFNEAFQRTSKRFWPLLGAQALAFVKIIGWLCLFIVPGIVAAYRYALLPYVVMAEEERKVRKIHDRTKVLVKKRLWEVFGIEFVAMLIPFAGGVVRYAGRAALFSQLKVARKDNQGLPAVHWLNYIGLIVALCLFALVAIGVLFILLIHSLSA